jgi:hypothetical protein
VIARRRRLTAAESPHTRLRTSIVHLMIASALGACAGRIPDAGVAGAKVSPGSSPRPGPTISTTANQASTFPSHAELQSLAEQIAKHLADDDPPSAVAALEAERSRGYDCVFRATFNGHAGFASVEEAEAEARKTARAAATTDFASATRTLSAGVLGVLVMAWCPKESSASKASGAG